jgi:hypothetical protein
MLFLTPFLVTHFGYYIPAKEWNANVMTTKGIVRSHYVSSHVVHYSCNCHRTCTAKGACITNCDTCSEDRYNGVVMIGYTIDIEVNNESSFAEQSVSETEYTAKMIPYKDYTNNATVEEKLTSHYPTNSTVIIYYNKNNPTEYRFSTTPTYRIVEICSISVPMGILGILMICGLVALLVFLYFR